MELAFQNKAIVSNQILGQSEIDNRFLRLSFSKVAERS
jgi:hypothetical protein